MIAGFYRCYQSSPDSLALAIGGERVTYEELGGLAQGVRVRLDEAAGHARLIGVIGNHDIPTYASLLGVLASGRGYVPLAPNGPVERNIDVLRQAGVGTVVASNVQESLRDGLRERSIEVVDTSAIGASALAPPAAVGTDDLAYVLFTSGSTGQPKGVPIRHRNLDRFCAAMDEEFAGLFGAADRFLQMFELTFDVSVAAFFYPLTLGASVHVVPPKRRRTAFDVLNTVQSAHVTVAMMVPSALTPLSNYGSELSLPDVRVSILTGEALPVSIAQAWAACTPGARHFNLYGPTEATIWSGIYDYTDDLPAVVEDRGVVSIGRPFAGFTFRVADASGAAVPGGAQGELWLGGDQVAGCYLNAADLTARAFQRLPAGAADGPLFYRTGDVVRRFSEHYLYNGRMDDQVQVGGHRVELGEVEYQARKLLRTQQVAAIAAADSETFVRIVLCIEGGTVPDLMGPLRAALPAYMVPHEIVAVPAFPLTTSGKIDKKQLRGIIGHG